MYSLGRSHYVPEEFNRTDATTQRLIASMTFEELITGQNGVAASRALVNVIIDQQIGQQIAVSNTWYRHVSLTRPHVYTRSILSAMFFKLGVAHSVVRMT